MWCNGKADPESCITLDGEDKSTVGTYHNSTSKQSSHISIVSNHLRHNGDGSSTFAPTTNLWAESTKQRHLSYTITFSGSPPNTAMYFCTHSRAIRSEWKNKRRILAWVHIHSRSYNPRLPSSASCTSLPPRKPNTVWSINHFCTVFEKNDAPLRR